MLFLGIMKRQILFTVLLTVLCSVLVSGQEKFSTKVKVYVQYDSQSIQEAMYSYIARELRSLSDVTIVTNDADYLIDIVMVDVVLSGRNVGYAISIQYIQPAKCTYKEKYVDGTPIILDCDSILLSSLVVSSLDNLKIHGAGIVTKFDIKILEPARKTFNLNNEFKKSIKP